MVDALDTQIRSRCDVRVKTTPAAPAEVFRERVGFVVLCIIGAYCSMRTGETPPDDGKRFAYIRMIHQWFIDSGYGAG